MISKDMSHTQTRFQQAMGAEDKFLEYVALFSKGGFDFQWYLDSPHSTHFFEESFDALRDLASYRSARPGFTIAEKLCYDLLLKDAATKLVKLFNWQTEEPEQPMVEEAGDTLLNLLTEQAKSRRTRIRWEAVPGTFLTLDVTSRTITAETL